MSLNGDGFFSFTLPLAFSPSFPLLDLTVFEPRELVLFDDFVVHAPVEALLSGALGGRARSP